MTFKRWLLVAGVVILAILIAYFRSTGRTRGVPPPPTRTPVQPSGPLTEARVVAVLDGDTVRLEGGERVRYLGIDTPELEHEKTARQMLGPEATDRNQQLVGGKTVRLETDAEDRDHFGRLLRHIWLDDRLVAVTLLEEGLGYAQLIPPNAKHRAELDAAQSEAREMARGLWGGWPAAPALFLTPVLTLNATPGPRNCPPDAADPARAAQLVGQAAAVCLAAVRSDRGAEAVYLRSAEAEGSAFTVVLFRSLWSEFPGGAQRYFDHRTLVARGRVELFEGEPELVVRAARDIRIVP